MDWTEIKITVDSKDIDTAGDIANMVVPYGIYIEDYSNLEREAMEIAHIDLIDEELLGRDRTVCEVSAFVPESANPAESVSFAEGRFAELGIDAEISVRGVSEEDWADSWKKYYKPFRAGERLVIKPS